MIRETARCFALQGRRAGDDRNAERARRFEQRDLVALKRLIAKDERFGHREIKGKLDETKTVPGSCRLARYLRHAHKRKIFARFGCGAKAVPCRHAVKTQSALVALALKLLERG